MADTSKKKSVLPPRDTRAKSKPGPKPLLTASDELLSRIRGLGEIQATMEEVAAVLRVSKRSVMSFFAENPEAKTAFEEGRFEGFVSLRRKQFAMADKNPAMAIWLGKQYLGQADKSSVDMNVKHDTKTLSDDELERIARGSGEGTVASSKGSTLTH